MSEDELSVVGVRSGDTLSLGDRVAVIIEDVAVLRRAVYAKRIVPESVLEALEEPKQATKPLPRATVRWPTRPACPRARARRAAHAQGRASPHSNAQRRRQAQHGWWQELQAEPQQRRWW